MKARWSQILESHALCTTCGWEVDSRNAQGVGAQHAKRYGHQVTTVVTMQSNYGPGGPV